MRISKELEQTLRLEHSRLKRRIKTQDKQNLIFAKTQCKTLLKCLNDRWDYDINQLFEEDAYTQIESILHDLRND